MKSEEHVKVKKNVRFANQNYIKLDRDYICA
jgi:hypothetical protein